MDQMRTGSNVNAYGSGPNGISYARGDPTSHEEIRLHDMERGGVVPPFDAVAAAGAAETKAENKEATPEMVVVETGPFKGLTQRVAEVALNTAFVRDLQEFVVDAPTADLSSCMAEYRQRMAEIQGKGAEILLVPVSVPAPAPAPARAAAQPSQTVTVDLAFKFGIVLEAIYADDTDKVIPSIFGRKSVGSKVKSILAGGNAHKSGVVTVGMQLLSVHGTPTHGKTHSEIVSLCSALKGTAGAVQLVFAEPPNVGTLGLLGTVLPASGGLFSADQRTSWGAPTTYSSPSVFTPRNAIKEAGGGA